MRKRRNHDADFKAQVAPVSKLAADCRVQPTTIR